jgi:hypothetical protein
MTNTSNRICHLSIKYADRLKRLCDPLHRYFGINYFCFSRTTSKGQFYSLGSHPDMHEYYYVNRFFLNSPFHKNPSFIRPGFYTYCCFKNDQFQHIIHEITDHMKIAPIGGIIVKENEEVMRFGYGADVEYGAENSLNLIFNPTLSNFI